MYKSYDLVLGEFKKMCGLEEAYKQDHHFNRFLPSSTSSNLSFTHKTPLAIVFSKFKNQICMLLKAKSVCFFMFKFHNNQIYFSALIKSVYTLIKFALCTSCLLYIQIYLLHS